MRVDRNLKDYLMKKKIEIKSTLFNIILKTFILHNNKVENYYQIIN